ncbi:NUDIX hydrolase [Candidatus Woesearchaeota archaeon]|jgi:8-oxo-dGTP diphosphatase|nr:NUDIX hydrolase [Candidatus Woesearchaeota archaeon]MBT4387445.1 NUDIX hydrolase [Candidatus Woesearchaeota archaeon]MBT4595822.1 NUDIX hydrolase [Candidatus Woesearchaeota archaeon]MBT5741329.1 NUDIX hydrolase [Candidatus Woesearchaeota archaeon]MBT6505585.1 NUDIX hydrolase [Candidatus Woesearchaeota archaeon]
MTDDKIKNNISTQKPRLTSSVIVKYNNKYLLGQRNKANMKNKWVFPGGGVEFGETLTMAAIREVKEETGIDICNINLFKHKELINVPGNYHSIVFFFTAEAIGSAIYTKDDISEASFFTIDEIKKLDILPSVKDILTDRGVWQD